MSKPTNGICWLYKCPNCGNKKTLTVNYEKYVQYKCTVCEYQFIRKKEIKKWQIKKKPLYKTK